MNEFLCNAAIRLQFLAELSIGTAAFLAPLAKRKHAYRRIALSLAGLYAMCLIGLPCNAELFLYVAGMAGLVWLCCEVTPQNALYCAACGYVVQHFCYAFRQAMSCAVPGFLDPESTAGTITGIVTTVLCALLAYFLFAKRMVEEKHYNIDTKHSFLSTIIVLLIVLVFSNATGSAYETGMEHLYLMCNLYDMFCCAFLLWIQASAVQRSRLERELTFQQLLRSRQKEQYELTRENIDLIDRKCHDLKYQMAALRTVIPEEQRKAYLEEVERSIQIYDSALETGNEVLDTVLMEKSLYCDANQINMTCVADGRGLSFMDSIDIYTIFGNALDNAIRAVLAVQEPEKRIIAVSVWTQNGLALFQFENYFEGELTFNDGLPCTTRGSKDYHGYGIRSIRETAKKYGGQMTLHTENHLFLLRVSVPIPAKEG